MRRIILGLITIIGAGAVIVSGATGAFFSDTETSTGNTFTAGAIDLKIDNDSYYNGNRCTSVGTPEAPEWEWVGQALFPVSGTSCNTSFPLSDLDDGLLFFNFTDLKPDDEGEDTISIHVQNDAWACMDLTLTADDDVSTTTGAFSITLADSTGNAWGGNKPLPANETVYIAKAWCFGTLELTPVPGNGGVNPSINPGVTCSGTLLGNETQTDMVQMTLAFRAEQARHNENFRCNPPEEQTGTLTVNKALLVSTGGIEVNDFTLHIIGPNGDEIVTDEIPVTNLPTGSYTVYEQITGNVAGKTFTVSFSGACSNSLNVGTSSPFALNLNDNITCTILNNEIGDGIGD